MVSISTILVSILLILFGFMVKVVGSPSLPSDNVTTMPFVLQNLQNTSGVPDQIAFLRGPLQSGQLIGDLLASISVQVHEKNETHGFCFFFIDNQFAIFIHVIAQKGWL